MANLQAVTAAHNLLCGRPAGETFSTEPAYIIDTLKKEILVHRNPKRTIVLPPSPLLH